MSAAYSAAEPKLTVWFLLVYKTLHSRKEPPIDKGSIFVCSMHEEVWEWRFNHVGSKAVPVSLRIAKSPSMERYIKWCLSFASIWTPIIEWSYVPNRGKDFDKNLSEQDVRKKSMGFARRVRDPCRFSDNRFCWSKLAIDYAVYCQSSQVFDRTLPSLRTQSTRYQWRMRYYG